MMKITITAILLAIVMVSAVIPAAAGVGIGVDIPIQVDPSEVKAVANPQIAIWGLGESFWQWDCLMGEYLKNVPTGIGLTMRVFPNVEGGMHGILKIYVLPKELSKTVKDVSKSDLDLIECQKDIKGGRLYVDVPVDEFNGEPICLWIFALVQDAKRKEMFILIPIPAFTIVNRSNASQYVGSVRVTTARWPWDKPTTTLEIAKQMTRAGAGGSGLVYDQLADADDQAREDQQAAEKSRKAETARVIQQAKDTIADAQRATEAVSEPAKVGKTATTITFWPKFERTATRTIWLRSQDGYDQKFEITADAVKCELKPGQYSLVLIDGSYSSKPINFEVGSAAKHYNLSDGGGK